MDFWTSSAWVMLMIIVCWLCSASKIRVKIVLVLVHDFGFTANPSPPFRPKRLTSSGKLSVHWIHLQTDKTWIHKHTFLSVTRLIIADHMGTHPSYLKGEGGVHCCQFITELTHSETNPHPDSRPQTIQSRLLLANTCMSFGLWVEAAVLF